MDKQILVVKFGGAALATSDHIEDIASIIETKIKTVDHIAVVVSAMGATTDELVSKAHSICPNPPKRELDMLISVGERISMALLAMALSKRNINALSFTGSQSGIITSEEHSNAKIIDVRPNRIQKAFANSAVAIVAGFQGVSQQGEITTLGRGGSDTTAVALGIALQATYVEFYKDVPGIFSEDPKKSTTAQHLSKATYDQVLALVESGGRILHSRAVSLAKQNKIPLKIRSFCKEYGEQETLVFDEACMCTPKALYEIKPKAKITS